MEDRDTRDYFDNFTPHFNPARFEFAMSFIKDHSDDSTKLIDIGCGDGATLWLIKQNTAVSDLTGMDVSDNYLNKARELVGCNTILGSILDRAFVDQHAHEYDFCVLGAVLHHLIGQSRRTSHAAAQECLSNALLLLKPGGYLVIFEPTYGPAPLMTALFYLKKAVGSYYHGRIELLRQWANLGQPVVSYYTPDQVSQMLARVSHAEIVRSEIVDERRLGLVIKRVGLGLVVQNAYRPAQAAHAAESLAV